MKNGVDGDQLVRSFVDDLMGKTMDQATAEIIVNFRMHLRVFLNQLQSPFELLEKILAEPSAFLFVPGIGLIQVLVCLRTEMNARLNFPRFKLNTDIFTLKIFPCKYLS